jgi:hypothetical protein
MKKRQAVFFLLLTLAGCKPSGPANNSATRYGQGLSDDAQKARAAADKANAAVDAESKRMEEAAAAAQ